MQSRFNHGYLRSNLTPLKIDYAISNNLTPFISMQHHHNLIYREEEREMFPTLKVVSIGSSLFQGYSQLTMTLAIWCWVSSLVPPCAGSSYSTFDRPDQARIHRFVCHTQLRSSPAFLIIPHSALLGDTLKLRGPEKF